MKNKFLATASLLSTALVFLLSTVIAIAQDDYVEMETTIIKSNTELPRILYLVPWKDIDTQSKSGQQLTLHNLYNDIFSPQAPSAPGEAGLIGNGKEDQE